MKKSLITFVEKETGGWLKFTWYWSRVSVSARKMRSGFSAPLPWSKNLPLALLPLEYLAHKFRWRASGIANELVRAVWYVQVADEPLDTLRGFHCFRFFRHRTVNSGYYSRNRTVRVDSLLPCRVYGSRNQEYFSHHNIHVTLQSYHSSDRTHNKESLKSSNNTLTLEGYRGHECGWLY